LIAAFLSPVFNSRICGTDQFRVREELAVVNYTKRLQELTKARNDILGQYKTSFQRPEKGRIGDM